MSKLILIPDFVLCLFWKKNEIGFGYYCETKSYFRISSWDMTPATVNAYYVPTRNQIVFPAGILQEPFFHLENPQSVNYGGIGTIMGHELSHGFDDSGREYDKNGTLSQWWNNPTIEAYNNATACIADQYSQYKINDEILNGKRTLGRHLSLSIIHNFITKLFVFR
jgi:predicted metalloendopeptidase